MHNSCLATALLEALYWMFVCDRWGKCSECLLVNGIDRKGNKLTGEPFVMFMLLATSLNSNTISDLIHVIFDHSPSHYSCIRLNMVASWNAVQVYDIPVGMSALQQKNKSSMRQYLRKIFDQGYTVATINIIGHTMAKSPLTLVTFLQCWSTFATLTSMTTNDDQPCTKCLLRIGYIGFPD